MEIIMTWRERRLRLKPEVLPGPVAADSECFTFQFSAEREMRSAIDC
jgi:hypothetical protein